MARPNNQLFHYCHAFKKIYVFIIGEVLFLLKYWNVNLFSSHKYNFVSFPVKMSTETKPSKAEYIIEQLNVNNAKKIALLTVMCFIMYHGYIHTRYGSNFN